MKFKHLKNKLVFQNNMLKIFEEKLKLPNNKEVVWSFIEGKKAVAVLAITDENEVVLVNQYRPAIKKFLLEIPAGIVEDNEGPEEAAMRELEEEVGYRAGKLEKLCEYYGSPGFSDGRMYIFKATELVKTQQNLDEDEFIEVKKVEIGEINNLSIEDSKTFIALSYLK